MTDYMNFAPIESQREFDYEQFRYHLKDRNLSREQENEIMDVMWKSMEMAVDEAWGLSPTQTIAEENQNLSLLNCLTPLDSRDGDLTKSFENANSCDQ